MMSRIIPERPLEISKEVSTETKKKEEKAKAYVLIQTKNWRLAWMKFSGS
jgi:hypothetical protein